MTDRQILDILASLNVVHVSREWHGHALTLTLSDRGVKEKTTIVSLKSRYSTALQLLEEKKQEIRENKFASRLPGTLGMPAEGRLNVEFLKRDDQLTRNEREEKKQLLHSIDREMRHHRNILSGLAFLQIRFNDLQAKIDEMVRHTAEEEARAHERKLWTRGVAAAAAFCSNQLDKKEHQGTPPVNICRDFLAKYRIQGEEAYTVEQLLNNVLQVRALTNAAK
jgi:hypothetical protein